MDTLITNPNIVELYRLNEGSILNSKIAFSFNFNSSLIDVNPNEEFIVLQSYMKIVKSDLNNFIRNYSVYLFHTKTKAKLSIQTTATDNELNKFYKPIKY